MTGSGYLYTMLSESLHILLNREEPVSNELLRNGLSFVVEEGTETAKSIEEV